MVVSELGARAIADYRARAVLLGLIGVLCLPLAFAGTAGALSFAVSQRTREIGIRIALGAEPRDIRRAVLRRGLAAVIGGLAAGIGGGVLLGGAMSAFLFEVGAVDVVTTAGVAVVLTVVAGLALWLPARRAARVEAAAALRSA
jgi:ABC-type antimicrobial peptide transport system permease subunit